MPTTPNFSQPAIFSQVSTPTVPDSGYIKVYGKSNVLCSIASGGSEQSYLTSSGAAANYLPLAGGALTGTVTSNSAMRIAGASDNGADFEVGSSGAGQGQIFVHGTSGLGSQVRLYNGTNLGIQLSTTSTSSSVQVQDSFFLTNTSGDVLTHASNQLLLYGTSVDLRTAAATSSATTLSVCATATTSTSFERFSIKPTTTDVKMGIEVGSAGGTATRTIRMGHWDSAGTWVSRFALSSTQGIAAFYYDDSNYFTSTVSSTGGVTFNAVGSGSAFTFSDAVTCSSTLTVNGVTTFNNTVVAESANVFIRTASLYFDTYGTHNGVRNRRANGTLALPTQVISGDLLGFWNALGYHDGGAFHATPAGGIYMYASENFTSTAHGGNLRFLTTPVGSTTLTNRVIIADNGNVGIGTNFTTPQKLLELSAADSATIRISSTDSTASVGQLVGAVEFYGSDATAPGARVVADIECSYVLDTGATELQFSTNNAGTAAIGARLSKEGYWGVGTELTINSITSPLDIAGNCLRVRTQRTPSSAAAGGNAGEWCNDANYIYICTASNTWKRVAIATW